jgi:hypothetical protein
MVEHQGGDRRVGTSGGSAGAGRQGGTGGRTSREAGGLQDDNHRSENGAVRAVEGARGAARA